MLLLDFVERIVFSPRPGGAPAGRFRTAGGRGGGTEVEADADPPPPFGPLGARRVLVSRHPPRRRLPFGEVYRLGPHGGPAGGRQDRAGHVQEVEA